MTFKTQRKINCKRTLKTQSTDFYATAICEIHEKRDSRTENIERLQQVFQDFDKTIEINIIFNLDF